MMYYKEQPVMHTEIRLRTILWKYSSIGAKIYAALLIKNNPDRLSSCLVEQFLEDNGPIINPFVKKILKDAILPAGTYGPITVQRKRFF